MIKKKQQEEEKQLANKAKEPMFLRKKSIKELIAPSGIDASNVDHLEIISNVKRYARSFFISTLPRMCTFPELFRDLYFFGDVNTSSDGRFGAFPNFTSAPPYQRTSSRRSIVRSVPRPVFK